MMGEVIDDHHEVASYRELSSQDQAGTCSSAARQLRPIGVAKQRKGQDRSPGPRQSPGGDLLTW
jgi:hypothetical protein